MDSNNDPCEAKVGGIQSMYLLHARELHKKNMLISLKYTRYLTVLGFIILPSLTSLDDPHIVAHLAEPNNPSRMSFLSSHQMILLHPSHPVSAPSLSDA